MFCNLVTAVQLCKDTILQDGGEQAQVFNELAPRTIQSRSRDVRLYVCLSVPLRVIVNYAKTVSVLFFCHTICGIDIFGRF